MNKFYILGIHNSYFYQSRKYLLKEIFSRKMVFLFVTKTTKIVATLRLYCKDVHKIKYVTQFKIDKMYVVNCILEVIRLQKISITKVITEIFKLNSDLINGSSMILYSKMHIRSALCCLKIIEEKY